MTEVKRGQIWRGVVPGAPFIEVLVVEVVTDSPLMPPYVVCSRGRVLRGRTLALIAFDSPSAVLLASWRQSLERLTGAGLTGV
jgi:hypothetical protein